MTAKWFNSLDTNSSLPTIGEQHRQNLLLAVEINVQKKPRGINCKTKHHQYQSLKVFFDTLKLTAELWGRSFQFEKYGTGFVSLLSDRRITYPIKLTT
mgnify:CR=1 FL=1